MNMRSVTSISKIRPVNIPQANENNYVHKTYEIINQLKLLIIFEVILGINRIYLLQESKLVITLSNIYCVSLLLLNIYFTFHGIQAGTTYFVVRNTLTVEYVTLVIFILIFVKEKLLEFFRNVSEFDRMLNIQKNLNVTSSSKKILTSISVCILYGLCEYYLEIKIYYNDKITLSHVYMLIVSLTHDLEQIFFYTLLRFIYLRLLIVKAHIVKVLNVDDKAVKMSNVESLCSKISLDISSLHKTYELLHKCSSQLNFVMSVPMLLIFFTSGISTIMLLKLCVNIFQISPDNYKTSPTIIITYLILRCMKHTLLLVVPCYYSSITNARAAIIRTTLHDAVNSAPLDKQDRRKVKTFFHLTRESDFSYALCGIIKLNMSLPLSYMSLCTTYLVIIIQFSKFID